MKNPRQGTGIRDYYYFAVVAPEFPPKFLVFFVSYDYHVPVTEIEFVVESGVIVIVYVLLAYAVDLGA